MPLQIPRLLRPAFSAVALASLTAFTANAATLYWDTNGATAGAGVIADGTWDTGTTANWTTDSTGSSATTTFTADDDVIFSAGSDVTTAAVITSGTLSAKSITIEEGAHTIGGSNITIGSVSTAGTITVNSAASATLNNLVLGNNTSFAVEGALTSNMNGAGKVLTKTGAGSLTLNDTVSSDYSINANGGLIILQRSTTKQLKASSVNSGGTLRIAANEQFGGNLAVNTGGTLELNANITETVGSLSGSGSITGGSNSTLGATGGTFSGTISGDLNFVKSGAGTYTFSGASTSSGNNVTVSAGTYILGATTGSLTFYIGANTISNKVTGAGTATFNGTFAFDLTSAVLADGNSWIIADVTNQSFASTFTVSGFTDDDLDNIWTNGAGLSFSESTGILSYSAIPEPSSYALFAGMIVLAVIGFRRRV
ncbi:PEP-CTERM sorting domain-containing protein [Rariglobus hedericola]|uniref:PEP-CTERM sorting domain-containing protein n=1 Tax=Rariglobus hedericola TaxID=2597822 RepID=A0A556QSC1_9BACT|nr:PEP-CTERM sorting domain-containing protein [Rariglobus hedericola]TSJ79509.1 PEP-CTERM sorting domain-containing protein [Rariglobus hedericola]